MRLFESRMDWMKSVQHPKLMIVVQGPLKVKLDNELYEHQSSDTFANITKKNGQITFNYHKPLKHNKL